MQLPGVTGKREGERGGRERQEAAEKEEREK